MTLLELTVVIAVLLGLLSILFIGAKTWKRGADRTGCVMNIRNVQHAIRSYQNLEDYAQGESLRGLEAGKNLLEAVNDKGFLSTNLYQVAKGEHPCPGNGTCECLETNAFPEVGTLFMNCSLSTSDQHLPSRHTDW
ncbi:MAG: type II secretion system protein [Luteolibacter sp.]